MLHETSIYSYQGYTCCMKRQYTGTKVTHMLHGTCPYTGTKATHMLHETCHIYRYWLYTCYMKHVTYTGTGYTHAT